MYFNKLFDPKFQSMELEEQEEDKEESDHVRQKRPKLDPNLLEKVPLPPKHETRTNGSVAIGSEDWHQVVPEVTEVL